MTTYRADDCPQDKFRNAVLDALDMAAKDCGLRYGWSDDDLPALFHAIDAQRLRAVNSDVQNHYPRSQFKVQP